MKWLSLIVILWLSQPNLLGQTVVSPSLGSSKIIKDSKDNLYRVNILTGKATYMGKTVDNVLNRDNRIRDTLKLRQSVDDIYVNAKKELLINGEPVDGMLSKNTLIQGTDGEEYVYTGEEIMGKKEFLATGGSSRLMDNYNKEKETKAQPDVAFSQSQQQKYGFDAYTEQKINIQNNYPELKTDYRPAFKSVESFATDKVKTDAGQGITFRDEMGIPSTKTADELTFRGSTNGSITALYAYKKDNDTTETIAGKLNLLSFDKHNKKVYLVPVNGAKLPNEIALKNTLNKIYAQAVTEWTIETKTGITVTFAGGQMTHGGSNAISVYNADQKAIIKTFGDMEKDALYLFFVKNVQAKDGDIGGYMPLERQAGFIYELPNNEVIAHELGHGAFNLRHTFSIEDNSFIAAQNTTENLMDYKGGTELWMHQWKSVQEPERVWLSFLEDEEEGEMYTSNDVKKLLDTIRNANKSTTIATSVAQIVRYQDIVDNVITDSIVNVNPNLSRKSFLSAFTHEQTLEMVENLRDMFIVDTMANLPTDKGPILLANKVDVTVDGKKYKLTINGYSMTEKIYATHIAEDIVGTEHKLVFYNARRVADEGDSAQKAQEKIAYQTKIDLSDLKNIRKAFDIIVHTESGYGTADNLKKYLDIKGNLDLSGHPTISNNGITIRLKRKYNNSNITIGELTVDGDDAVKLITVELRKGTNCADNNSILPKSAKSRICAGTYTFELNTTDNTSAPQHRYKSLRLHTKDTKTGGKREGILVHTGWNYTFTDGCILTMNHNDIQKVIDNPQNYLNKGSTGVGDVSWNNSAPTTMSLYEYVEKHVPNSTIKGIIIITDEAVNVPQSSNTKDVKKTEPTNEKSFWETALNVINEIIDLILE